MISYYELTQSLREIVGFLEKNNKKIEDVVSDCDKDAISHFYLYTEKPSIATNYYSAELLQKVVNSFKRKILNKKHYEITEDNKRKRD